MHDTFIQQIDGGRSTAFEPRKMGAHHEWLRARGTAETLYLNVRTPRGGSEYRPLDRFQVLPPLETVVVYGAQRSSAVVRRDDPRLLRAIAEQIARRGGTPPETIAVSATTPSPTPSLLGPSMPTGARGRQHAPIQDALSPASPWADVWAAIRQRVMEFPPCDDHPEHPCVRTFRQDSVNDILGTSEDAITVRSHRTGTPDPLSEKTFRQWWDHLRSHPTANIDPGHPNTPSFLRPVLIAPILLACLPHLIERRGSSEIALIDPPRHYLAGSDADAPEERQPHTPEPGDARDVVLRTIRARRGQQRFREALFERYGPRCMVTGCDVPDVLEAAHIRPYRGENDNHVENGLLLRADLHTLFDLDLLGIGGHQEVELHPSILGTYGGVVAKQLIIYGGFWPSRDALEERYVKFRLRCAERP